MFLLQRALAIGLVSYLAVPVCAFTFSYGNVLVVQEVRNSPRLEMPLTRQKYKNIAILAKPLYQFLKQCTQDCTYPVEQVRFETAEYRVAQTNQHMLIVQLDFNQELAITFLVFKNQDKISVKVPEQVVFKDRKTEKQVLQYLTELAQKIL